MNKNFLICSLIAIQAIFLPNTVFAQLPAVVQIPPVANPPIHDPFPHYTDKSRGWHFKEIIPEPEAEELPPPMVTKVPSPAPTASAPASAASGPAPLSPAWIRENMPKYMDAAIDNPTPQNISNYLYLQRFSMDKAEKFAAVYHRVAMADPLLDENNTVPNWTGAKVRLEVLADKNKENVLKQLAKKTELWFFFRSDCEPCHLQAPVLDDFARNLGFAILPISMNGKPMQNNLFSKFVVDKGQSQKLDVQYTPAIFLVKPPNIIIPISQGLLAIPDIKERVIEMAHEYKIITDEQYRSTRLDNKDYAKSNSSEEHNITAEANPTVVRDYLRSLIHKPAKTKERQP